MSEESNKPEFVVRDGAISASTWRNPGKHGDVFSTKIERAYKDKETGEWQTTNTFFGTDLLKVSRVAEESYQQEVMLKNERSVTPELDLRQARDAYQEQSRSVDSKPQHDREIGKVE